MTCPSIGHKEFKKVELDGRTIKIPKEWSIVTLGDITIEHKQGYYTNQQYSSSGIRLIRVTDLQNPKISYETMPMLEIDQKTYEQFKVEVGDFLIARSGAIGRYGIVTEDIPAIFGSYIIRFRFDTTRVDLYFLGKVYESSLVRSQLYKMRHGATNININAKDIKSIKIPFCFR